MDPKTGQVFKVRDADDARAKGLVPIPLSELRRVNKMTNEERIAWAAKHLAKEEKAREALMKGLPQGGGFRQVIHKSGKNRKQRRAEKARARNRKR